MRPNQSYFWNQKVLNWKTENALAQNIVLLRINHSVQQVHQRLVIVDEKVTQQGTRVQNLISALEHRLQTIHFDIPEPGV